MGRQAFIMMVFFMCLTGIVYPIFVTGVSQIIFPHKANGSWVKSGEKIIGSPLIGQKFVQEKYFWPRPSMSDYQAMPSLASNYPPISTSLKELLASRKSMFGPVPVPAEMLFASASGLDPHVSVAAIELQIRRVAFARKLNQDSILKLRQLIEQHTEKSTFSFLGQKRVNVFMLNHSLHSLDSVKEKI